MKIENQTQSSDSMSKEKTVIQKDQFLPTEIQQLGSSRWGDALFKIRKKMLRQKVGAQDVVLKCLEEKCSHVISTQTQ